MSKREYKNRVLVRATKRNDFTCKETEVFVSNLIERAKTHTSSSEQCRRVYESNIGNFVLDLPADFNIAVITESDVLKWMDDFGNNGKYRTTQAWLSIVYELVAEGILTAAPNIENMIEMFPDKDNSDIGITEVNIIRGIVHSETPFRCVRWHNYEDKNGELKRGVIYFDTESRFIQDLALEALAKKYPDAMLNVHDVPFFKTLGSALGPELPVSFEDFTIEKFTRQCSFYEDKHSSVKRWFSLFYQNVIEHQGQASPFTFENGTPPEYLNYQHFLARYIEGYRAVLWNPNDEPPSFDKWAVFANGLEQTSNVDKKNSILCFDFSRFSDDQIRSAAKNWFWSESKKCFRHRVKALDCLAKFFEKRDETRKYHMAEFIKSRHGLDVDLDHTIIAEEVVVYANECWERFNAASTLRYHFSPLKEFLRYLRDNDIYDVEEPAFEYLNLRGSINRGLNYDPDSPSRPIPQEDFKKLVSALEEKTKKGDFEKLCYIAFCLNTLTPLRISTILDLKRDCLVEKTRNGIYAISTKSKTTYGEKKDVQISATVKRLIEVALKLTEEASTVAPDGVKDLIFISSSMRYKKSAIRPQVYTTYIQRTCNEIGIPSYGASDLRKTYMTHLVEKAVQHNVSLMKLSELTGHANIDTTENYYVRENIRNYLEAIQGIEIGTMEIKGSIEASYDGEEEDLVDNGRGYCRNPECKISGTANCLMCSGFVTTPKHIQDFEDALATISVQISSNDNSHDKEHLYAVKRLYAAYLERLYSAEEECK